MSENHDTLSCSTEQARRALNYTWALIYSINGSMQGYWRHGTNGVPRFYDSPEIAISVGGKQIKGAGITGEIGLRAVRVEVRVRILPESAVSNGD